MKKLYGLSIISGACLAFSMSAQDFELSGLMEHSFPSRALKVAPYEMFLSCSGSNWSITQVAPATAGTNIVPGTKDLGSLWAVNEVATDGAYIYQLSHFQPGTEPYIHGEHGSTAISNSWAGRIMLPGFPSHILHSNPKILFYAYASAAYLNSVASGRLHRIQASEVTDVLVEAKVFRLDDALRLPKEIFFLGPGDATNAAIVSSNFTNIHNFQVPLTVDFQVYAHGREIGRKRFQVTRIDTRCSKSSFIPKPKREGIPVSDYRLSYGPELIPPIQLLSQGRDWPTIENAMASPSYQAIKRIDWDGLNPIQEQPKATPWIRYSFWFVVIAGFAALLALMVKWMQPKNAPHAPR